MSLPLRKMTTHHQTSHWRTSPSQSNLGRRWPCVAEPAGMFHRLLTYEGQVLTDFSGKSSIILLLLRLLDPLSNLSGNIEIDGVPYNRVDRSVLRRRLIAVPQDPVFLPDGSSIKENLDPSNVASDLECLAVLEDVRLTKFANDHGSIHTGIRADELSAGQKQLFSLGRALLRHRVKQRLCSIPGGVLLLDEVSSSVDSATDNLVQEIIKEEFSDYTIVMVSHRLTIVVEYFDSVVVLDRGRVVETGNPRDLAKTNGSWFSKLWAMEKK